MCESVTRSSSAVLRLLKNEVILDITPVASVAPISENPVFAAWYTSNLEIFAETQLANAILKS